MSVCLCRLRNGTAIGWGSKLYRQTQIPTIAQSNVTAISAGRWHSLARLSTGQVVGWGLNTSGQVGPRVTQLASIPGGKGLTSIAAGGTHSLFLAAPETPSAGESKSHDSGVRGNRR